MTDLTSQPLSDAAATAHAKGLRFVPPIALVLLSTLIGWSLAGGRSIKLGIPLMYERDSLLILTIIKRVVENPWIFHTDLMGAPFGSYLYDYPMPDSGSLLALKIFGLLSGSPAAALNLYYLLGFPLNALAAYFVLRKFRLPRVLSFTGGFVYTIAPFHFLRLEHLFYTWYFVAPIFIWYAHRIATGSFGWAKNSGGKTSLLIDICVLLVLSCFGVYYALFGVLALFAAGLIRSTSTRKVRAILPSLFAASVVSFGVLANVTPNVLYQHTHGVNAEAVNRSPGETEMYGLKLVQMLMPRPGHRLPLFATLNSRYSNSFPLVNENSLDALGLIASVGLIFLLARLIAPQAAGNHGQLIHTLASVTLVLLLVCTIGGISSIFSLLVSPAIRGWNRVSIFIAFPSICVVLIAIKQFCARLALRQFVPATSVIAIALCALALWDQTTHPCFTCLATNESEYTNDAKFVADLEKQVARGSMIYQLPYVVFPETASRLHKLETYDPARGYLHTSALKWSYGGIKGRPGDLFFRALAQQPMSRQVSILEKLGFAGIYIDRRGYSDQGAAIEAELKQLLGKSATLVGSNGQQAFFPLPSDPANAAALAGLSDRAIMERVDFVADALGERYRSTLQQGIDFTHPGWPRFVSALDGLSTPENWGRWTDANLAPAVKISFEAPLPKQFVLNIEALAFGPNVGKPVTVTIGGQSAIFRPTEQMQRFSLHFSLAQSTRDIVIQPAEPRSPFELGMSADRRRLAIGLGHLSIAYPR
ncbi:DUF7024 domain-containing protein [Burkholderia ubonensis]|uniref:DUF7024 domain-containing protein n=1 Tax=Burkholderia ubonensis TaxID=101571 RepID=UPI000B24A0D4|nr:sugar translocase [Burkholderia ubonensis]